MGEDDIYDCVPCDDDGDDIYEDIIKVEVRQPMVRGGRDGGTGHGERGGGRGGWRGEVVLVSGGVCVRG